MEAERIAVEEAARLEAQRIADEEAARLLYEQKLQAARQMAEKMAAAAEKRR